MLFEKIHLEDDERILKQVRKHWFILFMRVFAVFIAVLIPIGAAAVLAWYFPSAYDAVLGTNRAVVFFGYTAWLLVLWMVLFNIWTDYYLDVWTITNKRLIAVNQRGLFSRTVGSFRLERLQDMNTEVHGIIATFLNFGTLQAQTAAGSEDEFRADGLPDPRGLKSIILGAADEIYGNGSSRAQYTDGT